MTYAGYRFGQSEAGRRIERAGLAFQASQKPVQVDYSDWFFPVILPSPPPPSEAFLEREEAVRKALLATRARRSKPDKVPLSLSVPRSIVQEVGERRGVTYIAMIGRGRQARLCAARQEAMWECAVKTTCTLKQIGHVLHRDHSTVQDGIRQHCKRTGAALPRGMTMGPDG